MKTDLKVLFSSKETLQKVADNLQENPDWLAENATGTLTEEDFINQISRSYRNPHMQNLLVALVDITHPVQITTPIFDLLFHYPQNGIKKQLWISLSHKSLPAQMLQKLCETEENSECFFELGILYYTDPCYDAKTLSAFLERFERSKFGYYIPYFCEKYLSRYRTENIDKQRVVMQWSEAK